MDKYFYKTKVYDKKGNYITNNAYLKQTEAIEKAPILLESNKKYGKVIVFRTNGVEEVNVAEFNIVKVGDVTEVIRRW